MTALQKTQELLRITNFPLSLMVKNDRNPNKMAAREFDLLCDNMNRTGWTDPVLARPMDLPAMRKVAQKFAKKPDKLVEEILSQGLQVKIVGGHHRFDAGSFLGFGAGPVTIIMDEGFDEEQEKFQLVRMNVIHGKMDPQAFFSLYSELSVKYADDVLQDAFGFAEEAEFKKLVDQLAKTLPDKASQKQFKDAAKEIKTIDGLTKLLNELFTKFGDTLPFGYMVFDFGGHRSMWLRIEGSTMKALDVIGTLCIEKNRAVDDIVGHVLQLIAKGKLAEAVEEAIAKSQPVEIPKGFALGPTKDNLAANAELV